MSEEFLPTHDDLEDLFVNNTDLEQIECYVTRFNPIKVMRNERKEIKHSAVLAWLLDPQESHGLDDKFLKAFLGEALRGESARGYPTALDVSQADLRSTLVRREWQHIDILLHNPNLGWAFVIENKFDSAQHSNQLTRYIERVRAFFDADQTKLTVRGIFLTLFEEEPEDDRYVSIDYDAICDFLPNFIEQESHVISADVTTFLRHYLDIVREAVGESDEQREMERIARQLYRDHRKVLEFVMEHGETTSFEFAVQSLVGDDPDKAERIAIDGEHFHFDHIDSSWTSFLPESWYAGFGGEKFEWNGCDDWWLGFPLVNWLELFRDGDGTSGQLRLYGEVGPIADPKFRRKLIEAIQGVAEDKGSKKIRFQSGAADEGKKYSKFFKQNSLTIRDVQDADEIASGIRTLLKRFRDEFQMIGSVLRPFQQYGDQ